MRKQKFALKSDFSRLSCLKSGDFIKKIGVKPVFSFVSTKEVEKGQNSCEGDENNKISIKKKFALLLSGAVIGMLNGFFGGGGGMVCVPILEKVLNLDSKHSHATAIAVIFPLSLISAIIYVVQGSIQTIPLVSVGLGVVGGGILGAFALKFLPPKVVQILFAIVMLAGGIKLIL